MSLPKTLCFLAVLLFGSLPFALAQGTYTQIDYPGSSQTQSFGINAAGDSTGFYFDGGHLHGFLTPAMKWGPPAKAG